MQFAAAVFDVADVDAQGGDALNHGQQLTRRIGGGHRHAHEPAAGGQTVVDRAPDQGHVHIAARDHADRAVGRREPDLALHQRGQPDHAGALTHGAGALDQGDDGLGDGVVVDGHDLIDQRGDDLPVALAGAFHLDAVGDGVGARRHGFERAVDEEIAVGRDGFGLHANHADVGALQFKRHRDAGDQPAAAQRHHGHGHVGRVFEHLQAAAGLAGDDVPVVVGVKKGEVLGGGAATGFVSGLFECVALQHHLGAQRAAGLDLGQRRGAGHHHHGFQSGERRRAGDALCVVAG